MQVAILIVLILIAVILAPWLAGVVVAAVAVYGIWLVLLGAVALIGAICVAAWVLLSTGGGSSRKNCPNCQVSLHESVHMCPACGALV